MNDEELRTILKRWDAPRWDASIDARILNLARSPSRTEQSGSRLRLFMLAGCALVFLYALVAIASPGSSATDGPDSRIETRLNTANLVPMPYGPVRVNGAKVGKERIQ